jgi:aspartate racemase
MTDDIRKSITKRRHYECMGTASSEDASCFALRSKKCRRSADVVPSDWLARRKIPSKKFTYCASPMALRIPLQYMADAMTAVTQGLSEKYPVTQDQNHIPGLFFSDLKPGKQEDFSNLVSEHPYVFDLTDFPAEEMPQKIKEMATAVVTQANWSQVPFHVELEKNKSAPRCFVYRALPSIGATIFVGGGMGPDATADLVRRIYFHLPNASVCADQNTNAADRSPHYKNAGQNPCPLPELLVTRLRCEAVKGDIYILPCNSAHIFLPALQSKLRAEGVPELQFIHIAAAVIQEIEKIFPKKEKITVALFGTTSTIKSQMYPDMVKEMKSKIICSAPEKTQQETVMKCIYDVKSGKSRDVARAEMGVVIEEMYNKIPFDAAAGVCTEVPMIAGEYNMPIPLMPDENNTTVPFISSTDALAKEACRAATRIIPAVEVY